ncbi:hypothetical protein M5524_22035 [Duganella sp. BuS-21]
MRKLIAQLTPFSLMIDFKNNHVILFKLIVDHISALAKFYRPHEARRPRAQQLVTYTRIGTEVTDSIPYGSDRTGCQRFIMLSQKMKMALQIRERHIGPNYV